MIPSSDWCQNYDTLIWLHPARVPTVIYDLPAPWGLRPLPVCFSSVAISGNGWKMELLTMYKAQGLCKGISPQNMAKNMAKTVPPFFRILNFPLIPWTKKKSHFDLASQRGVPIQSPPRLAGVMGPWKTRQIHSSFRFWCLKNRSWKPSDNQRWAFRILPFRSI